MNDLLSGLLIGLAFGIPIGAIGTLTIQQTIYHGFWQGIKTGFGSTLADICYAIIGLLGIQVVMDFITKYENRFGFIGLLVLLILSWSTWKNRNQPMIEKDTKPNKHRFFLYSFLLALMNPTTIFTFLIAFTSFGIGNNATIVSGALLVLGITIGTGIWWFLLAGIVAYFRGKIDQSFLKKLNILFALILLGFSIGLGIRNFYI